MHDLSQLSEIPNTLFQHHNSYRNITFSQLPITELPLINEGLQVSNMFRLRDLQSCALDDNPDNLKNILKVMSGAKRFMLPEQHHNICLRNRTKYTDLYEKITQPTVSLYDDRWEESDSDSDTQSVPYLEIAERIEIFSDTGELKQWIIENTKDDQKSTWAKRSIEQAFHDAYADDLDVQKYIRSLTPTLLRQILCDGIELWKKNCIQNNERDSITQYNKMQYPNLQSLIEGISDNANTVLFQDGIEALKALLVEGNENSALQSWAQSIYPPAIASNLTDNDCIQLIVNRLNLKPIIAKNKKMLEYVQNQNQYSTLLDDHLIKALPGDVRNILHAALYVHVPDDNTKPEKSIKGFLVHAVRIIEDQELIQYIIKKLLDDTTCVAFIIASGNCDVPVKHEIQRQQLLYMKENNILDDDNIWRVYIMENLQETLTGGDEAVMDIDTIAPSLISNIHDNSSKANVVKRRILKDLDITNPNTPHDTIRKMAICKMRERLEGENPKHKKIRLALEGEEEAHHKEYSFSSIKEKISSLYADVSSSAVYTLNTFKMNIGEEKALIKQFISQEDLTQNKEPQWYIQKIYTKYVAQLLNEVKHFPLSTENKQPLITALEKLLTEDEVRELTSMLCSTPDPKPQTNVNNTNSSQSIMQQFGSSDEDIREGKACPEHKFHEKGAQDNHTYKKKITKATS